MHFDYNKHIILVKIQKYILILFKFADYVLTKFHGKQGTLAPKCYCGQNRLFSINFDVVMTNKAKKSMTTKEDNFFIANKKT
jgi:hypothetical protein